MAAHTMLDYALRYRRRGFSVIPCKKDKKPYIKWEPYQLQKPSEDEIKKWWTDHPDANIAIVCGQVSGVDVLDCDSQEAYDNVNDFYLSDTFVTPTVKTPKGRHLYFKHRPGLTNAVRAIKGTDIRTTGGYVVAPPSKNGADTPYYWFESLTPKDVEFHPWPDELFATLEAVTQAQSTPAKRESKSTPVVDGELFGSGRRDNDLFHIANCLTKGGCEPEYTQHVLKVLAGSCNPPFPPEEIEIKIKSAMQRKAVRDRNLSSEVREWVLSTQGDFTIEQCRREMDVKGRDESKNLSWVLSKLVNEDHLIERVGSRNGVYRLVEDQCQVMDWVNADCEYKKLWLPLGLGDICGVQPGNILTFAGAKDSGKTAFLMNIAKENRYDYKVHYFNSEMGAAEFKMRAFLFGDSLSTWKDISVYERSDNFHDVIKPGEGNLNIIDFLEVTDEFWKVGVFLQKIHKKLNGALCVVGLQKNIGSSLGRGGALSIEKARLYISLDYGKATITSCKNFKENDLIHGNPRGYFCHYKLIKGCRIEKTHPGWTSPIDTTKHDNTTKHDIRKKHDEHDTNTTISRHEHDN